MAGCGVQQGSGDGGKRESVHPEPLEKRRGRLLLFAQWCERRPRHLLYLGTRCKHAVFPFKALAAAFKNQSRIVFEGFSIVMILFEMDQFRVEIRVSEL